MLKQVSRCANAARGISLMNSGEAEAQKLRRAMVDALKQRGELNDARLEAAFLEIPRHAFLPDVSLEQAYADEAVPIKRDTDGAVISSVSQPAMIAMMLRQLRLSPGDNVLEIGAGSGYNAALMRHVVGAEGNVTTLDLDKDIVELAEKNLQRVSAGSNVRVVHADGAAGYAPRAAYDRIIATVGVWDVPEAWVRQLKPRGIVVAPIWLEGSQVSAAFTVQPDGTLYSQNNLPCGFIQMRGLAAGPGVTRRIGTSSLLLISNDIQRLDTAALHSLLSEDGEQNLSDIRLNPGEYSAYVISLVLNVPQDYIFASYTITTNQQAYGIAGHGFALIQSGSACFVPLEGHGEVRTFGGADAFMSLQESMRRWHDLGRPGSRNLRLRLLTYERPLPTITSGKLYHRSDHYLQSWLE